MTKEICSPELAARLFEQEALLEERVRAANGTLAKQSITFDVVADFETFERSLEERLKPALRKAITDVMDEFISDVFPAVTHVVERTE